MLETASTSRISPSNLGSLSNIPKEGWGTSKIRNETHIEGLFVPYPQLLSPFAEQMQKVGTVELPNTLGKADLATVISKNSHQVQVTSLPSVVLTTQTASSDTS